MVYLFLAEGFEEVEALAPLDILRRAGVKVKTIAVGDSLTVKGSHGVPFVCDESEKEPIVVNDFEGVILPGGMPGTINLEKSEHVKSAVKYAALNDLLVCAICAAPSILGHFDLLQGKKAVCFPGFEDELKGAIVSDEFVCEDGQYITAKGMGSAVEFGLAIAARFQTKEENDALRASLQIYHG